MKEDEEHVRTVTSYNILVCFTVNRRIGLLSYFTVSY